MRVSINGPRDLDLWPFDLETGMRVAGNRFSEYGHGRPSGSRVIRYVRDERTDRRTDGQKQRLMPPSLQAGGIISVARLWTPRVSPCRNHNFTGGGVHGKGGRGSRGNNLGTPSWLSLHARAAVGGKATSMWQRRQTNRQTKQMDSIIALSPTFASRAWYW